MRTALLTKEVERDLIAKAQQGDQRAFSTLIKAHKRMVDAVVRRTPSTREDFSAEGMVGLCLAIQKFDLSKDFRLSTYARWWIKAMLTNALVTNSAKRGIGSVRSWRKFLTNTSAIKKLWERGEKETAASIAGVSVDTLDCMLNYVHVNQSGSSAAWEDFFISERNALDELIDKDEELGVSNIISRSLEYLSPKEKEIITARYLAPTPATLQMVAQSMGVSTERVRQLEVRALKTLKVAIETLRR